ncbi:hypothetical protein CDD82_806 [Ophiocordyceps australis]|uniref:Homeobox domain-containing protein n=1 Tax=Ophiocordyceps australis TaxID=1399860 RepID=A0A2C5YKW8_9HYPO|nr:hypothetical protein CDD82_806 [Ophiocordyceps australis]
MLITRICDSEYSAWPYSKCNSPSARRPESPRMSDRYDLPLPVQPEWQGQQYSYLAQQHEGDILSRPYAESRHGQDETRRPQLSVETTGAEGGGRREHESPETAMRGPGDDGGIKDFSKADGPGVYADRGGTFGRRNSYGFAAPGPYSRCSAPSHLRTVLSGDSSMDASQGRGEAEAREAMAGLDDGDIDAEDDETDGMARPQTTEERLAARRKMKRFRLTHQQTRFLMSEFAKQPHPDAAHRERLSREIPGLSPRQVQVWFQNRRAKIKRLTADDRERMVRMRAVPEGFDNVQALHSPYGAVHALGGGPVSSPAEPYGNHMLRPLMVDVRRQEDAYMSPTGLTPSFGGIDLGPSTAGGGGASDLVSPLSVSSDQRYGSSAPRAAANAAGGAAPGLRSAASHIRDAIPRSAPDSLQSPMRGSVSFDYNNYQASSDRSYAGSQLAGSGFEPPYSSHVSSSTAMAYHPMQPTPQSPPSSRARSRAASASLPLTIDYRFRDAYRAPSSATPTQTSTPASASTTATTATAATSPTYARAHQPSHAPAPPPPLTTKHDSNGHGYSTGHAPPAPLSAPLSLSSPRVFGRAADCPAPQMSAPMSAPSDFSRAFQAQAPAPPTKDYFGNTTSM